jgi:ATP-binding cassette subfamily B (MDR/TAP) protein 1
LCRKNVTDPSRYGGRLVSTGEYTTGQFYTVFTAIIFSGEAAATFFTFTTSVTKARIALNYIFQLRKSVIMTDAVPGLTETDSDSSDTLQEKGAALDVDNVTFAYPMRPKLKVLRGIDVKIGAGKMIAFVGASGCGKSTMIAMLERFYDPSTGEIRLDGQDIKARDRRLHRRDIALVQQEPVLYQGSIRENIALGSEAAEPTEAAIIEACKQANIWDFIASLPEGLETPCGNQGLSLSGGQRQRIAIARALMRKPRLLLLDEATSALDTESEKVVKEALDKAAAGRTTVAVAHRLSTIRDADQIVVFGRGKVLEVGTHDRLVAKKGMYYEMVLGQSLDREAA